MTKNIRVKAYKQRRNGKVYIVKPYVRKQRKLGTKLRYRPAGVFYVAHDDQGNFRGSKVMAAKKKTVKKASKKKK